MVAHEVRLKVCGVAPASASGDQQLFTEEATSLLVFETGGVIRLSAAVIPGQLLFLCNLDSLREAVVQVKRKRVDRPTSCFVELEFTEPSPRFWGTEFSAATALLPKNSRDVEAAALVVSAESTADDPGDAPAPPTGEQIQALKHAVEVLRDPSKSLQIPTATESTAEPLQAAGRELPADAAFSSATISDSASKPNQNRADLLATQAVPFEQIPAAARCPTSEEVPRSAPTVDYTIPIRKSKRFKRARGNFTPAFVAGISRLAILTVALLVTIVGAAWYKHWIPWKSAAKKSSATARAVASSSKTSLPPGTAQTPLNSDSGTKNVASDAPITTEGRAPQTAELPNIIVKEVAPTDWSAASPDAPRKLAARPVIKKTATAAVLAEKHPADLSAAKTAPNSTVPSGTAGTVVPPKLIKSVRALASIEAVRDFETGNVIIDAVVGTSGEVNFVSVISGPPSLRGPAIESLKEYRYEPATRNGQPVPAHVTITIHFRFEP